MTAITEWDTAMAEDDTYTFPHLPEGALVVAELAGGFDGGTATLGYLDRNGAFQAFADGAGASITADATSGKGWEVRVPVSGILAVTLAGSLGSATLVLSATLCKP